MRFSSGARYWNGFVPQGRGRGHGDRRLAAVHCIALSEEGRALVGLDNTDGGMPSPGDLLESILHAIIGK